MVTKQAIPGAALWGVVVLGCLSQLRSDDLFVRGDADGNGSVQITDAVDVLLSLFRGNPVACLDAADADDNGSVLITDGIHILYFLFRPGSPPRFPFPHCGRDLSQDELGCESFPSCSPTFMLFGEEIAGDGVFFLVDRSGSMQESGQLELAKQAVVETLSGLPAGSQFGIVFFDANVNKFPSTGQPAAVTDESIAAATSWVDSIPGGGGSCIQLGLLSAVQFVNSATASRNVILYIGDGGGTCHGQNEDTYLNNTLNSVTRENAMRAQINTFGVLMQNRAARYAEFLTTLATLNGGTYTEVN